MIAAAPRLIVFTDLDGCLLNKHDYDWSDAVPMLAVLRQKQIPVVLNSSKTAAEMTRLVGELGLTGNHFISENGSVIAWSQLDRQQPASEQASEQWSEQASEQAFDLEVIGAPRDAIVSLLSRLKSGYRFRSFSDLGVDGVTQQTQLPPDRVRPAMQRRGTEPLLWDDGEEELVAFQAELAKNDLTITKGGRFWHVAGQTNKGKAMLRVAQHLSPNDSDVIKVGIGDSPIDQSMLDMADIPIGIPTASGLGVSVHQDRGILATVPGAAGWSEAIAKMLSRDDIAQLIP